MELAKLPTLEDENTLRILLVSGVFPPDIGGPATYVSQMAGALAGLGHHIMLVTLSDRIEPNDRLYPFRVIRLPRGALKPWRWVMTVATLVWHGRRTDLLFINGLTAEAVLANLVLRKPMVQKVVGDFAWERATSWGWVKDNFEEFQKNHYGPRVEVLRALRAWWTRKAHRVIVPSRYLARWVADWGIPEGQLAVIYNAVDPFGTPDPISVPLLTVKNVVTVGRLVPLKRVDKVIEVTARLDGVGLVIVGDGPERPRLEEQVHALGVFNRVYFAGQRSRAETLSLMAACDLFVLNSSHEGFPHVVLEAMSIGLPVVATAVGGIPEVVQDGENGRLTASLDAEELCGVLSQLLYSTSERERLVLGAKRTIGRFALEEIAKQTEALVKATVRERRR